jgi:beta-ketoacyl-acyl-carrier-protein synthase II
MPRRVVVTGLGVIAPNGIGKDAFWQACTGGVSAARKITKFDTAGFTSQIACEVRDFDAAGLGLNDEERATLDRHVQFAVAAANQAIDDAGLDTRALDTDRAGAFVGSTTASAETFESVWEDVTSRGSESMLGKDLPPRFYFGVLPNAASASIAVHHGLHGPSMMVSDACSSGINAIDQGRLAIIEGSCDVVVAGGSDASVTPMGLASYCVLGAVSKRNDEPERASRPFDLDRDGFVLAEGAAVVVLEEADHARRRGATIYGEILAIATNTNAFHMTALPKDGGPLATIMRTAMKRAGVEPSDVGYLNAHGTATPTNDRHETVAAKAAFGDAAARIPISSTKSLIGHTQGAASAHQLAVLCMTLRDQVMHPTINLDNPDPVCDLDYVPHTAREARIQVAMGNACGFGGINSTVVVSRWES